MRPFSLASALPLLLSLLAFSTPASAEVGCCAHIDGTKITRCAAASAAQCCAVCHCDMVCGYNSEKVRSGMLRLV